MMVALHGLRNCDKVRAARRWLEERGVAYRFHDFREPGLDPAQLADWCRTLGWEQLLNRRGATWRSLPDTRKNNLSEARAQALMLEFPALIKRPLLVTSKGPSVGFSAPGWAQLLGLADV